MVVMMITRLVTPPLARCACMCVGLEANYAILQEKEMIPMVCSDCPLHGSGPLRSCGSPSPFHTSFCTTDDARGFQADWLAR